MKYMSFNNSCSFAGIANMLTCFGIEMEDFELAKNMNLQFLLDKEDDCFLTGPMLQNRTWFNLYLNSLGISLSEQEVSRDELTDYIVSHVPSMLGVRLNNRGRHAVVFMGFEDDRFKLLNNKRRESTEPTYFLWTEKELRDHVDDVTTVGTLERCDAHVADYTDYYRHSLHVLDELWRTVEAKCSESLMGSEISEFQGKVMRAVLLDNIAVLNISGEKELAERFSIVQRQFMTAIKNIGESVRLADYMDMKLLHGCMMDWKKLIGAVK